MSKQAVIFDLDNCLSPANAVGESLFAPAFEAIRRAGVGAFSEDRLASAFADCWIHPYDWVAAHHGFSAAMRTAGWDVLRGLEVQGTMRGYDDLSTLERLASRRFLVTSGFRRLQASKIRALAIAPLF